MPEHTIFAIRFPCIADLSAKPNEPMTKIRLLFGVYDLHKRLLHLFGRFAVCKPQTIGNTNAMRICHDGGLAVDVSQNEIGNLSADPGERSRTVSLSKPSA